MNAKTIYRGTDESILPIEKRQLNEEWLCRLRNGKIEVMIDLKTRVLETTADSPVLFFLIHDDELFKVISMSKEAELDIFTVDHDDVLSVYPNLGSEVNAGLYSDNMITTERADERIVRLIEAGFDLLDNVMATRKIREQAKMRIHVLSHIYLTFYNIGCKSDNKSTTQSFRIINEMNKLFDDDEAYRHRDTQYFADRLNISVRYLFEVCRNEAGRSAKELINETITSKIRHTILTTYLSFKEIADMFNFPDQTAFTQYFKRNTGMTPSEFAKRYK